MELIAWLHLCCQHHWTIQTTADVSLVHCHFENSNIKFLKIWKDIPRISYIGLSYVEPFQYWKSSLAYSRLEHPCICGCRSARLNSNLHATWTKMTFTTGPNKNDFCIIAPGVFVFVFILFFVCLFVFWVYGGEGVCVCVCGGAGCGGVCVWVCVCF